MNGRYTIREFANLAGVTVKALHHYDRLGLLKPARTDAGYRVYSDRDLETLEQLIALKFLGIPLKEIGAVLKRPALKLPDVLRLQRQALEDRQAMIGRAIRVIRAAEDAIGSGRAADAAVLKKIIEVIDMQDSVSVMKKYHSEESWEQHRRYYEEGPSTEWQQFYRDAQLSVGEDPASEKAQALVQRWLVLSRRAHAGDPEALADSPAAWMDREHWPEALKERVAELRMEEVQAFIKQAAIASSRPNFSEGAWSKLMALQKEGATEHNAKWLARVELFRDIEAALVQGEDPGGERGQALGARWKENIEAASGGDPEIKRALLAGWAHRKKWPEERRFMVERLHMMSFERFERAADFLDSAVELSGPKEMEMNKTASKSVLLEELEEEMAATRMILERVPEEKWEWTPHEKSPSLGRLANHLAAMPGVAAIIIKKRGARPPEVANKAKLLESFDKNVAACREAIEALSEEQLAGNILVTPTIEKQLLSVLRGRGFLKHLVHHRGQMTVYLRLLGVAVPGMYGPSADER